MKDQVTRIITSLLAILFASFHISDDIVRGMSPGGLANVPVLLVLVVWLYGTLVLADRRTGYIISLVASFLASCLPVVHFINEGGVAGGGIAGSGGAFFFAWTLIALGVTSSFSVVLAARGLLSLQQDGSRA